MPTICNCPEFEIKDRASDSIKLTAEDFIGEKIICMMCEETDNYLNKEQALKMISALTELIKFID